MSELIHTPPPLWCMSRVLRPEAFDVMSLQDLPPALATLNDRLLAARLESPPPPVLSPGIAAALEAAARGTPETVSIPEMPEVAPQGQQQLGNGVPQQPAAALALQLKG